MYRLKNKGLPVFTIVFFLIVNTSYFWEGKLGVLALFVLPFLMIVFIILGIMLLFQLIDGVKERFADKSRNSVIAIVVVSLGLISLKPNGLINFDEFQGENVLFAQREGAANCMTTFRTKPDGHFRERTVCFGITEIRGKCQWKSDTLFFSNVSLPRGEQGYYQFALLQPSKYGDKKALVRYKNRSDTVGHELWVVKHK